MRGLFRARAVEAGAGVARGGLRDRRASIDSILGRGTLNLQLGQRPCACRGSKRSIKRKRERDGALRANAPRRPAKAERLFNRDIYRTTSTCSRPLPVSVSVWYLYLGGIVQPPWLFSTVCTSGGLQPLAAAASIITAA